VGGVFVTTYTGDKKARNQGTTHKTHISMKKQTKHKKEHHYKQCIIQNN
jgi:tRNA U54 and U55 pseudouridine synthase Pus10